MIFLTSLPARVFPVVLYSVVALRVADEHGNLDPLGAQDDELHLPDAFPAVHDESPAMVVHANPHINITHSPLAPSLLTKMRATLLKKTVENPAELAKQEVQNATTHVEPYSDAVRNISAVPMGAAPLHFQHGDQSEFQTAPHQAALPQMPQPHMLGAALQSPEVPDELPPVQLVSSTTWMNNSKRSGSQTLIESIDVKSGSNITIGFKVELNSEGEGNNLHIEINSALNDTVVEPQTWMTAPNKEPTRGPLHGKPFTTDPLAHVNTSVTEEKNVWMPAPTNAVTGPLHGKPFTTDPLAHHDVTASVMKEKNDKLTTEDAPGMNVSKETSTMPPRPWHRKAQNDPNDTLPLPPRTLYGQGAPGIEGNSSVALVAKSQALVASQPVHLHDGSARTTLAPQASLSEPQAFPSHGKRASIVRRSNPDDSATRAVMQDAEYYPGHWGSESPAILREPKDGVVRKQVGSEAAMWTILITMAILISVMILLFCAMPVKNFCIGRDEHEPKTVGEVRRMVESLRITTIDEIQNTFKPRGGYDCLLIQPQNPGVVVRVQGVVVAAQQATLRAPITRRDCVLFSTSALEHRLDGVVAPPQAFHSMAVNFVLELTPHMKLQIRGQDVALFDMVAGRHEEHVVLREASDLVQDFMRSYRTPFFGARETDFLNFQECVLEVGAKVTCIGEVRRSESGELGLWPIHQSIPYGAVSVSAPTSGLTSWERLGSPASGESQVEKVMISDDPKLLRWDAI
jgi:hypothetical protein